MNYQKTINLLINEYLFYCDNKFDNQKYQLQIKLLELALIKLHRFNVIQKELWNIEV